MKSITRGVLAGIWCMGSVAAINLVAGCYHDHDHDQVDIVDEHGFHHQGYYDDSHNWHGGYYDADHQYHDDAQDWHH